MLEPSFRPSFTSFYFGRVANIFALPDGKFLFGGPEMPAAINGVPIEGPVARLNQDGTLDTGFFSGHLSEGVRWPSESWIELSSVQADGKALVTSYTDQPGGGVSVRLMRLNTVGAVDNSFDENFFFAWNAPVQLTSLRDGRIALLRLESDQFARLTRLDSSGKPDLTFSEARFRIPNASVSSISEQRDGKLVISGGFSQVNDQPFSHLVRLNLDGTVDQTFRPSVPVVNQVAVQNDQKILFSDYPGRISRLSSDGGEDPTFQPRFCSVNRFLLLSNGKLLVSAPSSSCGSSLIDGNGTSLARLNADGSQDLAFSSLPANTNDPLDLWFFETLEGKILVASYAEAMYRRLGHSGLALLNPDGSLANEFRADVSEIFHREAFLWQTFVSGIATLPDGEILVAGSFDFVNGAPRNGVIRLHKDGTLDSSFSPQLSILSLGYRYNPVAIAAAPDGKIILAATAGDNETKIVRFLPDGTLEKVLRNYAAGDSSLVISALAVQADGRVLVGGHGVASDGSDLARLDPDGTFDDQFRPGVKVDSNSGYDHISIALQASGRIVLAGALLSINSADGTWQGCLARLRADGSQDKTFDPWRNRVSTPRLVATRSDGHLWVLAQKEEGLAELALVTEAGLLESADSVTKLAAANAYDRFEAMSAQPDGGILLGGTFSKLFGRPRLCLARLIPSLNLGPPVRLADGQVQFQVGGGAGSTVIEATTDLAAGNWQKISPNTVNSNRWLFTDADAPNFSQRFYRAVSRY